MPRVQSLIAKSETRRRSEDRRYEGSRIRGPRSQFYLGAGGASDAAGVGAGSRLRFRFRRFGIRLLGVIGGLFMGGADGFAPGICAVGVDVFVLG